jgi:hypothetical protein
MPITPKPRTEKQREASRRNGAKSRGPITPAGIRASARNSIRHGLCSRRLTILQNESPEFFREFVEDILARYRPVDRLETELCIDIANARWRLRRAVSFEAGLFDLTMDRQDSDLRAEFNVFDEVTRQSAAFQALADRGRSLALLSSYESRLRNAYKQAVDSLHRAQAERRAAAAAEKSANEPEHLAQNKREEPSGPPAVEPTETR